MHGHLVRHQWVAPLVDDGERHSEPVAPDVRDPHTPHVGRDDREGLRVEFLAHVLEEHRHGEQVVDRPVEEALDLGGVQVDRHDAVGSGHLEEIGDQAGGDRLATATLLVLARVRVVGGDDRDALGGCTLEGIHHDQLLHQPFVDGRRVRLDDEGVGSAHALVEARIDLAVRESTGVGGNQVTSELVGDLLGQGWMRTPRDQNKSFLPGGRDS